MSVDNAVALVVGAPGDIRGPLHSTFSEPAPKFMLGRSMARLVQPPPPENAQGKCHFVVADLTENGAVGRIAAAEGPPGCLVLSSGICERSREPAALAHQIAANLLGLMRISSKWYRCLSTREDELCSMADGLRDKVNASGYVSCGFWAIERQRAIFAAEGCRYPRERLIQPAISLGLSLIRPPSQRSNRHRAAPMQKEYAVGRSSRRHPQQMRQQDKG